MAAIYKNSSGATIKLGRLLGQGGEGSVFACSNQSNIVAKIYKRSIDDNKAAKLQWMRQIQNDRLLKISAWVVDTLHDPQSNRTVGFVMPNIHAKEIHELYSTKSRKIHFPKADWRFLIHTAINLARAFYTVHSNNLVIGDVNQGNFVVMDDGTVKLIDCDSYHINANGRIFPCEVGVTTHIPPEFQGKSLRGLNRLPNHDNFGLAVVIFQLLFLGRHPFSGNFRGHGADKTLEECIKERRFAYGPGAASRQVEQPTGTLALEAVSAPVADLFERAFVNIDNRPSPREWIEALQNLTNNLGQCTQQSSHYYLKSLSKCPWCDMEGRTGLMLFPVNFTNVVNSGGTLDLVTIENLINSIRIPASLPASPQKLMVSPPVSPEVQQSKKQSLKRLAILAGIELMALGALVTLLGPGAACGGGLLLFLIAFVLTNGSDENLKKDINSSLKTAQENWRKLESEWSQVGTPAATVISDMDRIRQRIAEYKAIPALHQRRLKELDDQVVKRQLNDYLDRFRIDRANIGGIGDSRAMILQSHGIETAADVQRHRILSISGFGPTFTSNLLAWRASLERKFRFDPSKGVDPQDRLRVEHEISKHRTKLEAEIKTSVASLKVTAKNLNDRHQYLASKAAEYAKELAQAESNFASSSLLVPSVIVLLSVWFIVPLIGAGVLGAIHPPAANNTSASPRPTAINSYSSNSVVSSNSALSFNSNITNTNSLPPLTLTDTEIAALSYEERKAKSLEIFNAGVTLTKLKKDSEAQVKYKEALLYDPSNARIHHELGYSLYRQGRFADSIDSLLTAIAIDPNNAESYRLLGLDYIADKRWNDAKELFLDLRQKSPNSFQYQYNLGIAAENANDPFLAIDAFKSATKIKPSEPRAHYDLALVYISVNQYEPAEEQYNMLIPLDSSLAARLKKELDRWR